MRYYKSSNTYSFSGTEKEAIAQSKRSIEDTEKDLHYYKWLYEKAMKDYNNRLESIKNNREFIKELTTNNYSHKYHKNNVTYIVMESN